MLSNPFRVVATTVLAVALLAACGDDDDRATSTPTPTATGAATPTPTPTPTPAPTPDLEFSTELAMEHVVALADEIGARSAGSEGERLGAEYVQGELASYGYDAALEPFAIEVLEAVTVALNVVEPEQRLVVANVLRGSTSGDAEGALVFAGLGAADEFPAESSGGIALIERGTLTFGAKVENAATAGAIAAIVYNNEPGPFEASLDRVGEILAVSVSREDGLVLRDLAVGGARVSLSIEQVISTGESNNVVARMPGTTCRVVIGGHHDSVPAGPGANDNASGTAVVLELARVLAARDETDGVCIALFGAEEIGLVGSTSYVASLSEADHAATEGMLNFDMLGVGDDWPLGGTTEIVELAGETAEAAGIPYRIAGLPAGTGSDHASFDQVGIPNIIFNCFCDPSYHTAADRSEFIRPERLAEAGAMGLGVVERLLAN